MIGTKQLAAGLLAAVALVGCVTTPVERQDRTVSSVTDTRKEMIDIRAQVDRTLSSLNALVNASPNDMRKTYQQYAKDVEAMRKDAAAMDKHASNMEKQTGEYLAGWQRAQSEIQNPELRDVTGQRREIINNSFQRIQSAFRQARRDITPFLTRLEDIRRAAGNDLTAVGISSIAQTDAVTSANSHGAAVSNSLDVAIGEFDQLVGSMAASPR